MQNPGLVPLNRHVWTDDPRDADTLTFQPTEAIPGSEEKLLVLIKRLDAGLPLWHPSDRCHVHEPAEPQRESA